jgi:hypothetical protein
VFWPLPLAKAKFGEPKKSEITTHKHAGSVFKGIIMDPSHGNPIGTILLSQTSANATKQITTLANTDQSVRGMDEVKEVFAALQGRLHVGITLLSDADKVADAKLKMTAKSNQESL